MHKHKIPSTGVCVCVCVCVCAHVFVCVVLLLVGWLVGYVCCFPGGCFSQRCVISCVISPMVHTVLHLEDCCYCCWWWCCFKHTSDPPPPSSSSPSTVRVVFPAALFSYYTGHPWFSAVSQPQLGIHDSSQLHHCPVQTCEYQSLKYVN